MVGENSKLAALCFSALLARYQGIYLAVNKIDLHIYKEYVKETL